MIFVKKEKDAMSDKCKIYSNNNVSSESSKCNQWLQIGILILYKVLEKK